MPSENNIPAPEPIRILRSALPYLGFSMQHQLSLALKFLELQNMMHAPRPKAPELSLVRGSEHEAAPPDPNASMQRRMKMLQSIRGACNPEHAQYVDTVMQTFRMQSMIQNIPSVAAQAASSSDSAGPVIPFLRSTPPKPAADPAPEKSASDNDLENTLKAMLNPSQQAMFQSLSGMLKQQMASSAEPQGGVANG